MKIIIKSDIDLDPEYSLALVGLVCNEGKISGKDNNQYCYLTKFRRHTVYCKKNKGQSFTFTITKNS